VAARDTPPPPTHTHRQGPNESRGCPDGYPEGWVSERILRRATVPIKVLYCLVSFLGESVCNVPCTIYMGEGEEDRKREREIEREREGGGG
jgi:hypothetical protein